jgi:hypothetical protein
LQVDGEDHTTEDQESAQAEDNDKEDLDHDHVIV